MNITTLYYNQIAKRFYDPNSPVCPQVYGLSLSILDLCKIRLAVTNGYARIDANGVPTATYQIDMHTVTDAFFSLKDFWRYFIPEGTNSGNDNFSSEGFDASDTAWHNPSIGCFTLAGVVVPYATLRCKQPRQQFVCEITLYTGANSSWTLSAGYLGFMCDLLTTVLLGTASAATAGTQGPTNPLSGNFSISNAATSVVLTIAGMTASGQIDIGYLPATGSPTPQIFVPDYSVAGQVTVRVPNAPGTGNSLNGRWTLIRLS